jgi:hypothetical protein
MQWLSLNILLLLSPSIPQLHLQPLHLKNMSQTAVSKTSKVAAARELVIEHLKSLPEREKCKDEDFVVWGRKFLELMVCCQLFLFSDCDG